ncbi:MAG TPA: formate dehydrogenase accessory sulfurtransferase FdhD, partial [Steroidobacteraceae bacterium]|nr:formate dehydrogenase accessory sulfurtransferase FdhD [Steroidobacteraceae bacterium]
MRETAQPIRSPSDPLRQIRAPVTRFTGSDATETGDELVIEEPLELRAAGSGGAPASSLAVIMRTPGHDDELAAGFLLSEGLIAGADDLASITPGTDADGLPSDNVLEIALASGADLAERARERGYSRQFAVSASCGICGKHSVDAACAAVPPVPEGDLRVSAATLYSLPDRLRTEQRVFSHTGGLHAAALFTAEGALLALREDVGRHNAVDKLVGRAVLDGTLPLGTQVLLVSGRVSFEIVLKALVAGVPLLAAISAP